MKPLYTNEEFNSSTSRNFLKCECYTCNKPFFKEKREINRVLSGKRPNDCRFCSKTCLTKSHQTNSPVNIKCTNCGKVFTKPFNQFKKTNNHFCSRSCNATYNNKNKTHGTKRSKLEVYIEEQLTFLYPNLPIDYNKKDTIGSELDIFIPSLNIAFELNGIFHYEPIYGVDKLNQIQNNDISKSKLCHEHKIDLCVIDISNQKKFKINTSQIYINIIIKIINERLLLIS